MVLSKATTPTRKLFFFCMGSLAGVLWRSFLFDLFAFVLFAVFVRTPSPSFTMSFSLLFPLISPSFALLCLISCLFSALCSPSLDLLTPVDPQVALSHQRCGRLIYIAQCSLQVVSASGKKKNNIPFQHFGDSSTWPQYLLPPLTCHVSSRSSLLLPDLRRTTRRRRDECGVADKRLVWDQGSQTAAPRSAFRSSFPTAADADSAPTEWPSKISGWLRNRFLGQDTT